MILGINYSEDIDDISQDVTYIGTDVFRNIAIDNLVLAISMSANPEGMFRDCDSLTSITTIMIIGTLTLFTF